MAGDPLELTDDLRERVEALGLEFMAEFFERHTTRAPDDVGVLVELGHLLTQLKRYDQGLAVDRKLADLLPDESTVHYNLACSLALTGQSDEAFGALQRAIELGYDDAAFLRDDEDLQSLRGDPRFDALLGELGA